jgi:hypothetical protein
MSEETLRNMSLTRWEFLLVAPPLPVTRGVGTPINPYAMK